jgi:hypothetical protein
MSVVEPILQENKDRFVIFPIKHQDIWEWYKKQEACIWTAEEIDLHTDLNDWNNNTSADSDSAWNLLYVNFLTQARIAQNKALEANNFKMLAVSQIVEAHAIGTATSLWGDIPYSEFKILDPSNKPKFDKQSLVYSQLQTLLDEAIANLTKSGAIPTTLDIYYAGNTSRWTQLAYSLKARYFLHTKKYSHGKR